MILGSQRPTYDKASLVYKSITYGQDFTPSFNRIPPKSSNRPFGPYMSWDATRRDDLST